MVVRATNDEELKAEINVTPLVDVVLVLLIVFMVMTPLLKQEVPIDLPIAETAQGADASTQVTVSLSADGRRLVNGVELAPDELVSRLAAIYAERPDKTIFLEADRGLPHGQVVDLMDDCRAAGISRIGVITKRESPPSRPGEPASPRP